MRVAGSITELRQLRRDLQGSIGFVPTMGALHAGHLALVEAARECDHVVVSIFVNPSQFAATEDLSKYPRDLPRDLDMLRTAGVDLVFTPTPEMMYPPGYQTWVDVEHVSQGLEGQRRPGHFRGVATVVAGLFNLVQPDFAYFGQKDAQQVAVIKQMARDLKFPLEIIVIPTMRESGGLAMSSRNVYLSPDERRAAGVISWALRAISTAWDDGEREPARLRELGLAVLVTEPSGQVEYLSFADPDTLRERQTASDDPCLVSLTVRFGATRLLDNMLLPASLNTREGLTSTLGVSPSG
ncbi:MAG TPA: pantoate--beta-alanine ligase [Aggregatilineales bacterium]|nr:pantoate--beta-alanine ligase [Aggregatilineales bacterium]